MTIRLNVAAILKEHKKLEKKKLEEEKIIKDLEINMRDSTEFENWRDNEKKIEEVQIFENQQRSLMKKKSTPKNKKINFK